MSHVIDLAALTKDDIYPIFEIITTYAIYEIYPSKDLPTVLQATLMDKGHCY